MKKLLILFLSLWSLTATAQSQPNAITITNPGYLGSLNLVPTPVVYQDSFYSMVGDGVDGLVSIPNSSNYAFDRTSPFTISFAVMFNSSDVATSTSILTKYDQVAVRGWYIQKISSKLRFVMNAGSGNNIVLDATNFSFTAAKWWHIAITHDGTSLAAGVHVYINGVEAHMTVTSNTLTNTIANTKPIELFHRDNTAGFGKDAITHVQIFNTALTNDQCGNLWGGLLFDKNPIAHYSSTVLNWFADDMAWGGSNYTGSGTTYTSGVPSSVTVTTTGISNGTRTSNSFDIFDETNLVFDTRALGDPVRIQNFNNVYPQTWYSPRTLRTYRTYMEDGGTGSSGVMDRHNVKRVMYWDHQTNKPSKIFTAGTGKLDTDDKHLCTTFAETGTGHQLICYEYEHNTSLIIKRNTVAHDLETFVTVATIASGATDISTSPLPVSYPQFKLFSNGEMWYFLRHGRSQVSYIKSVDDGLTWTGPIVIANGDRNGAVGGVETNLNWYYPFVAETNDDIIRIGGTHTGTATTGDNGVNLWFISYIESVDKGVTWRNASGSFSKLHSTGIVTSAELFANCYVDGQYSIRHHANAPDGTHYFLGEDVTTGLDYVWVYTGGSWTRKSVSFSPGIIGDAGVLMALDNTTLQMVCLESVSGKNLPGLYSSTNKGTSWTLVRRLSVDAAKNYLMVTTQLQDVPPEKRLYSAGVDNTTYENLLITP